MLQQILISLSLAAGTAFAAEKAPDAKEILEKMNTSMDMANYQGTVVFLKNDKLETMKYYHTVSKDRRQERLVSLNSPQREIVRNSDEVKCSYKLSRQEIIEHRPYEHSFIVDVPKNLAELETSYTFDVVGEEEIAMLPAYVVSIQPKDDYRYIRKIWIAKGLFLPLKAVTYDQAGVILDQVVFTELKSGKPEETGSSASLPRLGEHKEPSVDSQSANAEQVAFETTTLPKGFKQIFFVRRPLHKSGKPVDHLLLSDGFASVSVYLEENDEKGQNNNRLPEGIHSVGATNSISRSLANRQLTVLGEVPAATVKYIAEGVKLRQTQP